MKKHAYFRVYKCDKYMSAKSSRPLAITGFIKALLAFVYTTSRFLPTYWFGWESNIFRKDGRNQWLDYNIIIELYIN